MRLKGSLASKLSCRFCSFSTRFGNGLVLPVVKANNYTKKETDAIELRGTDVRYQFDYQFCVLHSHRERETLTFRM